MKLRHFLLALAIGPAAYVFSAPSVEAAMVASGPFDQACAQGSGETSVFGSVVEFSDYLNGSGGVCYIGALKFSDFGDLSVAGNYGNNISIVQQSFPPASFVDPTLTVTSITLSAYEIIDKDSSLNYRVSGAAGLPVSFASFWEWSVSAPGWQGSNYVVTTTADPMVDSECTPAVVTTAQAPQGPTCNVPSGSIVNSFLMTNTVSNDWLSGGFISNTFVHADALPPAGGNPSDPLLPPRPQWIGQPWRFPPFWFGNPNDVWWLDPEVTIGYIYNLEDPNGPLFDQYTAPDLPFNDSYELLSTGGAACSTNPDDFTTSLATITQQVPYDFTTPLACFAIKGISEQNALDPLNTMAFVAAISFDKSGMVAVSQTPIPTPGPLPLLAAGVGWGWARGLRSRLRKVAQDG